MTNPRINLPRAPGSLKYQEYIENLLPERRTRQEFYTEVHHILPRCMGGTDDLDNLIYLKPSEHLLAHKLLVEAYPDNKSLKSALWFMSHLNNDPQNDEEYEELRLLCRPALSTRRKGDCSPETLAKISKAHKGKVISEEHKKANSLAVSNYIRNTTEGQQQAAAGGRSVGVLPWWNKDGKTSRSAECPGSGWTPGRGNSVSAAMSAAGSKNKGKFYWHKIGGNGEVIRRRSFEPPGNEFTKGYGPKR